MKIIHYKPVCSVTSGDMQLKILRTGKSVRLPSETHTITDPKTVSGVHSHFTYEIFFVTNGILELATEESVTAYERVAVIVPPRLKHYTVPRSNGCFCLLIAIEGGSNCNSLPNDICTLPLSADACFYITKIAEKTKHENKRTEQECAWLCSLLFSELLSKSHTARSIFTPKKPTSKHINEIEQYINAHLYQRITLSDVADAIFLSERQISRIITAEYGCSLSQLVIVKKLDTAQMLLRNTDMSVAAIATKVNVGANNYFFRLFRKRFGVSPLQYRIQAKKRQ